MFGLDSELWSIIASFCIFGSTTALTISTTLLARSAHKQEKLTEAQTKAIVSPRIAIRSINRTQETRAYVLIRNVGIGPADNVTVTVSRGGKATEITDRIKFLMGPGDERTAFFDLPADVDAVDSVEVVCHDVLGNKVTNSIKNPKIQPIPSVQTF